MTRMLVFGVFCLRLTAGESEPKLPCDYFASLLRFRLGEREARFVDAYPFETLDNKNGYCAKEMDHGGMGYLFAEWKSANGRVFGFSQASEREGNLYETTFWRFREGQWLELKEVVPAITLADFEDEHRAAPAEMAPYAFFEIKLPRHGTTIVVGLKGICVRGDCRYEHRVVQEATYNEMDLIWNAGVGRFSKGSKRLVR